MINIATMRSDMTNSAQLLKKLQARGIVHPALLAVIANTPRERFVLPENKKRAYENTALPIDCQQTISQPYIVALMSQALLQHPNPKKILEIGTGSGYQAAILAQLFPQVWSIERIASLHHKAKALLAQFNFHNIHLKCDDGFNGWPEQAPFDGIIVTAAAPSLPSALIEQLSPQGGLMVIPLGAQQEVQKLTLVKKQGENLKTTFLENVVFVPMIKD